MRRKIAILGIFTAAGYVVGNVINVLCFNHAHTRDPEWLDDNEQLKYVRFRQMTEDEVENEIAW